MSFHVVDTASDGASSKRQCVRNEGEKEDNLVAAESGIDNKLCFLLNHGDEWVEWEEKEEKEEHKDAGVIKLLKNYIIGNCKPGSGIWNSRLVEHHDNIYWYQKELTILIFAFLSYANEFALLREVSGSSRQTVMFSQTSISYFHTLPWFQALLEANSIPSIEYKSIHSYLGSSGYNNNSILKNIVDINLHAVCFYGDTFGYSLKAKDINELADCWIEMQKEFISNGHSMRARTHRIVGTDADDNEIIKGIVYSPKGNLSMEKVIDTLTLDGIVACFIDLICDTKIKQYRIVFDADPSEEYLIHLKLSTSYFRSRIVDIISGKGPSVGIVCSGIKLSFKIVSKATNEYIIIPSTLFNVTEFQKNEFTYESVSLKLMSNTRDALIFPENIITEINKSKILLRAEITSLIATKIRCNGMFEGTKVSCCKNTRNGGSLYCGQVPCNRNRGLSCMGMFEGTKLSCCDNTRSGASLFCCQVQCNRDRGLSCMGMFEGTKLSCCENTRNSGGSLYCGHVQCNRDRGLIELSCMGMFEGTKVSCCENTRNSGGSLYCGHVQCNRDRGLSCMGMFEGTKVSCCENTRNGTMLYCKQVQCLRKRGLLCMGVFKYTGNPCCTLRRKAGFLFCESLKCKINRGGDKKNEDGLPKGFDWGN